jgi:hypothetical protein
VGCALPLVSAARPGRPASALPLRFCRPGTQGVKHESLARVPFPDSGTTSHHSSSPLFPFSPTKTKTLFFFFFFFFFLGTAASLSKVRRSFFFFLIAGFLGFFLFFPLPTGVVVVASGSHPHGVMEGCFASLIGHGRTSFVFSVGEAEGVVVLLIVMAAPAPAARC